MKKGRSCEQIEPTRAESAFTRYQPAYLRRLGDVEQIVEQRLVLVLAEQVELLENEHDRLRLLLVAAAERPQQERQVLWTRDAMVSMATIREYVDDLPR